MCQLNRKIFFYRKRTGKLKKKTEHEQVCEELSRVPAIKTQYMAETLLKIISKCPLIEEELEKVQIEMRKPGKSPSEIEELKAFATVYTTFLDIYKPSPMNE